MREARTRWAVGATIGLVVASLACKQASELLDKAPGDAKQEQKSTRKTSASANASATAPAPPPPRYAKTFAKVEKAACKALGKGQWVALTWASGDLWDDDPAWVYFVSGRVIKRIRKSDAKIQEILRANLGPNDTIGGISIHDEGLYFTMKGDLTFLARDAMAHMSNPATKLLAAGLGQALAEDEKYWYAGRYDKAGKQDQLTRTAKGGDGKVDVLYRVARPPDLGSPRGINAIQVDGQHVYFSHASSLSLYQGPKVPGEARRIHDAQDRIDRLKADDTHLYFTIRHDQVERRIFQRLPKTGGEPLVFGLAPSFFDFRLTDDAVTFAEFRDSRTHLVKKSKAGKLLEDYGENSREIVLFDDDCVYGVGEGGMMPTLFAKELAK